MRTILAGLLMALMLVVNCFPLAASAAEYTLVDTGSSWKYSPTYYSNWNSATYDDSEWLTGTTPFGDHTMEYDCELDFYKTGTNWPLNSTYYLRKEVLLLDNDTLTFKIAIDNNFVLYIDGKLVKSVTGTGCPSEGEYQFTSEVGLGYHTIAVKITDKGGANGFNVNVVSTLDHVVYGAVAGGGAHSMLLKTDGTVQTWGDNAYGQLGDGTTTSSDSPLLVDDLSEINTISTGKSHSLAVKNDGTAWSWGRNYSGQLGDGTTTDRSSPVQVSELTDIIAVAAGASHSLALKANGTVLAWGENRYGQLGDGTTTNSRTPITVSELTNITAIAADNGFSLALESDGTVWAWGYNGYGQLGDLTTTNSAIPVQVGRIRNITAIAVGYEHALALRSDGTVWSWGRNNYGQLGDTTTTDRNSPVQVSGLSGITAIACGRFHSLALKEDGTVQAWGSNAFGQLGNATATDSLTPVAVSNLSAVIAIEGGYKHSLAITSDEAVWSWGSNAFGQLGTGKARNSDIPAPVAELIATEAFVEIEEGCFWMGSDSSDYTNEQPSHYVCLDGFEIGKYEVTQGTWQKLMGSNPSWFSDCGSDCPVEQVAWDHIEKFITTLNDDPADDCTYRLPTEAEWEYACRGGGESQTYCGGSELDELGWYDANSGSTTHPVGQHSPNGLGIHDMSGNVWEWVSDYYGPYSESTQASPQDNPTGPETGYYRVHRGGSWYDVQDNLRATHRNYSEPDANYRLGLRLARTCP